MFLQIIECEVTVEDATKKFFRKRVRNLAKAPSAGHMIGAINLKHRITMLKPRNHAALVKHDVKAGRLTAESPK